MVGYLKDSKVILFHQPSAIYDCSKFMAGSLKTTPFENQPFSEPFRISKGCIIFQNTLLPAKPIFNTSQKPHKQIAHINNFKPLYYYLPNAWNLLLHCH